MRWEAAVRSDARAAAGGLSLFQQSLPQDAREAGPRLGRGLCVLYVRESKGGFHHRPSGFLDVVQRGCLPRPRPQAPWRLSCALETVLSLREGKKDNLLS